MYYYIGVNLDKSEQATLKKYCIKYDLKIGKFVARLIRDRLKLKTKSKGV